MNETYISLFAVSGQKNRLEHNVQYVQFILAFNFQIVIARMPWLDEVGRIAYMVWLIEIAKVFSCLGLPSTPAQYLTELHGS